jgi:hypothetical protein
MAKRQRDYHAEYVARTRRARSRHGISYGALRWRQAKAAKLRLEVERELQWIPSDAIMFTEHTKDQLTALKRIEQYGASRDEITKVEGLHSKDFWAEIRPILERTSADRVQKPTEHLL